MLIVYNHNLVRIKYVFPVFFIIILVLFAAIYPLVSLINCCTSRVTFIYYQPLHRNLSAVVPQLFCHVQFIIEPASTLVWLKDNVGVGIAIRDGIKGSPEELAIELAIRLVFIVQIVKRLYHSQKSRYFSEYIYIIIVIRFKYAGWLPLYCLFFFFYRIWKECLCEKWWIYCSRYTYTRMGFPMRLFLFPSGWQASIVLELQ